MAEKEISELADVAISDLDDLVIPVSVGEDNLARKLTLPQILEYILNGFESLGVKFPGQGELQLKNLDTGGYMSIKAVNESPAEDLNFENLEV